MLSSVYLMQTKNYRAKTTSLVRWNSFYGKVAAKRVIDQIPMTIERECIQSLLKEIEGNFKRTDAQLSVLLRESAVLVVNRKKLNDMIFILNEAEKHIESFLGFH